MREIFTSGSVGGAPGNRCIYPEADGKKSLEPIHLARTILTAAYGIADCIVRFDFNTNEDMHMKIVADTNTFLAVALNEPEKSQIIKLTTGHELVAPDVLPFEIGNALTAMMRKRLIKADQVTAAWDSTQSIRVSLYRTNIRGSLKIASELKIYAYDSYFLECASSLQLPLLTLDRRLREAAQKYRVKIIEVTT
ncbi:type II toxin-antitoxin system VapC family toxin [Desulfococcaceae bacterium HSG8]|nr:type II toxin-antitoxin system VapC family toxin [Desulfococcaceae bacterium HSG8]